MSIKSNINLVSSMLYLYEVIQHQTIGKAAEKNGIKPSNLSLIISNLEKQIGVPLLNRTHRGCFPTPEGQKIFDFTKNIEQQIKKIEELNKSLINNRQQLNIYISPNLELGSCLEFEQQNPDVILNHINNEALADIKLLNTTPSSTKQNYTELRIGSDISQKIWICCNEDHLSALKFFDFIVAKLFRECAQSKP